MSKRKLVTEVASGSSSGEVKVNEIFLNNIIGDTKDESEGKLELGSTMLDIRKGLEIVTKKNGDENLKKYTIMLYISRGAVNNAAQFLEIESEAKASEIIEVLFKHLKYRLPSGEKISRRKDKKHKYFGSHDGFYLLQISHDHAYIYIGHSDGRHYKNNFTDVVDFVYRNDPDNKPKLCSIM